MIWWHNLTFQPFPLVVKQAPRRKVLLTGPALRNSLSSLISTHGQAGGVHAVRDQPSSLKGRNNWYTADEAKKRRRHQILPQARLSKSEEELSVCKTWKEDISKESHLLWQYFGGGGCENQCWDTEFVKRLGRCFSQQAPTNICWEQTPCQIWLKSSKESTLKWYRYICCQ